MNQLTDRLNFDAKAHRYTLGKGKDKIVFVSVTNFIKQFFSQFDATAQARKSNKNPNSKYYKMGVRKIKALWEKAGSDSRDSGTQVHKEIQEFILGERDLTHENTPQSVAAYTFFETLLHKYPGSRVYSEQVVYSTEWKLAGTIDLLVINPDGTAVIVDWKTSKEIKREGYTDKSGVERTGLGPCSDLPDANYFHYWLQLSAYAAILEKEYGFTVERLHLVHVTEAGYVDHRLMPRIDKIKEMIQNGIRK